MSFHFFTVEALAPTAGEAELSAFCAEHRVASFDRQFVADGTYGYWLFCLTTVEGDGAERSSGAGRRGRVDYREVLSETDFAVYADLRELRKSMAEQEGVPMYALFTNEQLAAMVTRRATTIATLGEIDGVGKARIEKYGKYFLPLLGKAFAETPASPEKPPARSAARR